MPLSVIKPLSVLTRDACHVPRTRGKRERRSCPHKVWGHERERLSSPHKVWERREMNVMSPQHIQRNERETSTALHMLKPSGHEDRITRGYVEFEALVTTVPLGVSYGGAKPLGPFLGPLTSFPGVWPVGHARGVRGPKSTVPSSANLVVVWQQNGRTVRSGLPCLITLCWEGNVVYQSWALC